MVVILSLVQHFREPQYYPRQQSSIYWSQIRVRYKLTGNQICVCKPLGEEQMTDWQLTNCVTTMLAKLLPAPRISIRLSWIPSGRGEFDVEVFLNLLTFFDLDASLYDETCDPASVYWEEEAPCHSPDMMGCLCCGDSTLDVDSTDPDRRWEHCVRCLPRALCSNCRCLIEDVPVCMRCLKSPEDLSFLTEKQLRWYGFFAQNIMPLTMA